MLNEENPKKARTFFDKLNLIKNISKYGIIILILSILICRLKFKLSLILSIIISLISILFIIIIIAILVLKPFEIFKKAGYEEEWNDLYGEKIINIPYYKNDMIINTFKKDSINFNEEIGNINNGKDYHTNERNYYDLYIPYSSLKRKNEYNGIILTIHGGGWITGSKELASFFCCRYAKYGYITATMNHTLLVKKYKEYNIFRIVDEITSCIENIKEKLKNEGFDENKLELALAGFSSGAHLSLLYGYSMKNISPLPIKFVINIVGPVSLEPKYWIFLGKNQKPLENIESKDIENGLKEKKIKFWEDENYFLNYMNLFIGEKYSKKELKEMIENKKNKIDNEKFKEIFKVSKYGFPIIYVNSSTIPTLCQYGGRDPLIGIGMYSYLKDLADKYGNKLELVYMKDGGHALINYETEEGVKSMREMHYQILNFAKTYFTSNSHLYYH